MFMDPMRVCIAGVLVSRRQAVRSLLSFWIGGVIACISVGIAVLLVLRDSTVVIVQSAVAAMNELRSAIGIIEGGRLQITLGVIALAVLARIVARERARVATPVGAGGHDTSSVAPPAKSGVIARLGAVTQAMVESGSVWPCFLAGLASTFPPIEGPIALTVIMASKSSVGMQLAGFMTLTLIMLVFVEIPLVGYFVAPEKTAAMMLSLNSWLRTYRLQIIQISLAVSGVLLLYQGVTRL